MDFKSKVLSLESVPVVREFPKVFPNDFPVNPPEWEIDFSIISSWIINPLPILPYRMAPVELNRLKEKPRDFLDKGFIQPLIYSRDSHVLFVGEKWVP